MKLAAICDFAYWDEPLGSAVRFGSLARSLSKAMDLTVVTTKPLGLSADQVRSHEPFSVFDAEDLERVSPGCTHETDLRPHQVRDNLAKAIKTFITNEGFDAVLTPYFNRKWMVEQLSPDLIKLIDTHDCQSQRARSLRKHGLKPTFDLTPDQEAEALEDYDLALVMSDDDLEEFSGFSRIPMVVAPFRLPLDRLIASHSKRQPRADKPEIIFVAANSEVNRRTLSFLLQEILPFVGFPITLNLVGNVEFSDSGVPPSVEVVRHVGVEDLRPIYQRSHLALNPTFAGGGVKTKTLEALAFGVPVLTTDEGARGLAHLIPSELIANSREAFTFQLRSLLNNQDLREKYTERQTRNVLEEPTDQWLPTLLSLLETLKHHKERSVS